MSGASKLPQKRKLPPLPENELKLYDLIWSKGNLGMLFSDMKRATGLPDNAAKKALNSLQAKNLIKDVKNINKKGQKFCMAVEFEPSKEISGGSWYSDGILDVEFIKILRGQCQKHVERLKVVVVENVWQSIRDSGIFTTECTMQQIEEIMGALVLDKEIEEMKSSGIGDFSHIKAGRKCYRCLRYKDGPKEGSFSSIPCGVCPRIAECSPQGFQLGAASDSKWLQPVVEECEGGS